MTLTEFIDKRYGGSQRDFARDAGVNEGQLSKWLSAERREPTGQLPSATSISRIQSITGRLFDANYWAGLIRPASRTGTNG